MAHRTILHGYIDEQVIASSFYQRNDERIAALPDCTRAHCPLITRDLFAAPHHASLGRIIPFGAAYKGVEGRWKRWREEFEALLRDLYWWETQVWVKTELWGEYHCTWTRMQPNSVGTVPEPKGVTAVELEPTRLWRYRGPTRAVLR